MARIPQDGVIDSTPALLTDGYEFVSKRCQKHQSDVFETRLMLRKTICMKGAKAAELFYDTDRFQREGAMPKRVLKTLLGEGGVQGLDDEAHRHRKRMFLDLMAPEEIARLVDLMSTMWSQSLTRWKTADRVVLHPEVQQIIFRAVCLWAGVPLDESEIADRTGDLAAMIDGAGGIIPRYRRGVKGRNRAEQWAAQVVADVRAGRIGAREGTALAAVSYHRELDRELLDEHTAAVELLNVIRPTVAVARFVTFSAVALHEHPDIRERIANGSDEYLGWFVQEVRRFYPFFPLVGAVVRKDFDWNGYRFPAGRRVLLDLYGTNHDERSWVDPRNFKPERFANRDENPYDFIPQGGGDHARNHRCPGEWITIELMKAAAQLLVHSMSYEVPPQDLTISLSRIPAIPESGFVITNVKTTASKRARRSRGRS